MKTEIIHGKDNYHLYYIYDGEKCIESGDSDGRKAYHFFDKKNRLIETRHINGFWRKWLWDVDIVTSIDSNNQTDVISLKDPIKQIGYHGTSLSNAKSIQQYGFDKQCKLLWPQSTGNLYVFSNTHLYSKDSCFNLAKKFALKCANNDVENAAIITVKLTNAVFRKYSVDCYDPSFEILSDVSPDDIIGVTSDGID